MTLLEYRFYFKGSKVGLWLWIPSKHSHNLDIWCSYPETTLWVLKLWRLLVFIWILTAWHGIWHFIATAVFTYKLFGPHAVILSCNSNTKSQNSLGFFIFSARLPWIVYVHGAFYNWTYIKCGEIVVELCKVTGQSCKLKGKTFLTYLTF